MKLVIEQMEVSKKTDSYGGLKDREIEKVWIVFVAGTNLPLLFGKVDLPEGLEQQKILGWGETREEALLDYRGVAWGLC